MKKYIHYLKTIDNDILTAINLQEIGDIIYFFNLDLQTPDFIHKDLIDERIESIPVFESTKLEF